jgi:hypothetical protein
MDEAIEAMMEAGLDQTDVEELMEFFFSLMGDNNDQTTGLPSLDDLPPAVWKVLAAYWEDIAKSLNEFVAAENASGGNELPAPKGANALSGKLI